MNEYATNLSALLPDRWPSEANNRLLLFVIRRVAACGLNDAHVTNALESDSSALNR